MKKIISLSLVAVMLFLLVSCNSADNGKTNSAPNKTGSISVPDSERIPNIDSSDTSEKQSEFILKNKNSVEMGTPDITLDPKTIYDSIEYTPKMFYGDYHIRGGREAENAFGAETEYFTWSKNGKEIEYSVLPYGIEAGEESMSHILSEVSDFECMRLSYMRKYGENNYSLDSAYCAYSINGNKLVLKVIDTYKYDEDTKTISYAFTDQVWEYTFEFNGRYLTLSTDTASITLETGLDAYHKFDWFSVSSYLSPNSKAANGMDRIGFHHNTDSGDTAIYIEMIDGESSSYSIGTIHENGLLTITLALEESTVTYQYVYFYCDFDGIILTDGENVYYYNDTFSDRNKNTINEYITEDQTEKLEDLTDSQLEDIVTTTKSLIEELETAFENEGIKVTVNKTTGEIAMDASVLFGGDSAVLTDEGKAFLDKFVAVYSNIIFSEKYNGIVSKTIVEGHTAPVSGSTYESGLPLSEERAENVKAYCVSAAAGENATAIGNSLESVGYSNSKPVKDADGNVDMVASRRVSFRFIIDLDKIV